MRLAKITSSRNGTRRYVKGYKKLDKIMNEDTRKELGVFSINNKKIVCFNMWKGLLKQAFFL
jgi:hypothetical protein